VTPPAVPLPQGLLGWMTFVGVMTILAGAFNIMSCVGIPAGVLMVIAGGAVLGAKGSLIAIPAVHPALAPFFYKMKRYFLFTGIGYLLVLIFIATMFLLYFGVIMALIAGSGHNY
jgi:hypothetical protein